MPGVFCGACLTQTGCLNLVCLCVYSVYFRDFQFFKIFEIKISWGSIEDVDLQIFLSCCFRPALVYKSMSL